MRGFLLVFGWASLVGSIFDGAIAAILGWLIYIGSVAPDITVDTHLKEHLPFLYWVRAFADAVLPTQVVSWIFALPALVYFPVRVITSLIIGGWALGAARRSSR